MTNVHSQPPSSAVDHAINSSTKNPTDQWVATDALGRELPTFEQVGPRRTDKVVGVFYYIWVGNHTKQVHDITEILKAEPGQRAWGDERAFHFWGQPEYGYHHASDPWVIRRDLQMLTNAGVDFLYFDTTNALIYEDTVTAVLTMSETMRAEGVATPDLCFTTNAKSGQTMNRVYDAFYKNPRWKDHWFHWQGKPLILGQADDPQLRPNVKSFFTIKYSWAWTKTETEPNHWQWLDRSPQDYGWSINPNVPEQIPVSTAQHPVSSRGKSFRNDKQPNVKADYTTPFTDRGLHFQEQWNRAHAVDPPVVMVAQWNEWLAQRFVYDGKTYKSKTYAGYPLELGDSYFVDVFSREFNRDMAPMKGGYTDNYYYQLVSNIRKLKGMDRGEPRPEMQSISIDGKFSDWQSVSRIHYDPVNDTMHRSFQGTDPKTIYTNDSGRNDIVECRTVHDPNYVYFTAVTKAPLTKHTDRGWMFLLIDLDRKKTTGWEGYELLLTVAGQRSPTYRVLRWDDDTWIPVGVAEMAYRNNQLELRIPTRLFAGSDGGFDFKWLDNPQHLDDATAFFLDGDAAPDRRFNYRY